ncbi:hypothetical protein Ahy_A07g036937 [Arachis hypogaea]|uniref:Ubiquitin-like protease family profile domain-containing protein n=1 Tax=Arachis hypogaea TaxID=3818 RepID=A0A445CHD6_ARAHY|nr:hypothetical protein Ahy_A07g036937 [Arachis hypogaea]
MSEEKKTIVRDLGFGGLMHIPPLRVHHQILRELANSFKLGENRLETGYDSFKVTQKNRGYAWHQCVRRFQGKTLKNLTDEMMAITVDNEQDRLMFKRIFILYIQMAFLLPMTINKISPVHLAPIFKMDTITERNWGGHVLNFIIKGITDYKVKKKKAIDGCLFALMIIYFHLSKNKDKKRAERPPEPWIANWSKEQLVERMRAEMEDHMVYFIPFIMFLNNDCLPSRMESKKRKKIKEDSDSKSESTDESEESSPVKKQKTKKKTERTPKKTQSKKKKVIVQDSSPEQAQSYHGSEIGTQELDEFLRENNEKSAAQGEKEADLRSMEGHYVSSETLSMSEENMMVVREETQSEGIAIVSIQVCLPLSQTTSMPENEQIPETENEPTPLLQIEGTKKSNPAPEDAAALMMMARTASYVPKADPLPSFSVGLTDSSQEEAATHEGASTQEGRREKTPETPKLLEQLGNLVEKIASSGVKAESKSPQIQKESGRESSGKFETPARINQNTAEMKENCYIWGTRLKKYADGSTNEFDNVCTLIAQDKYILTRMHLASLKAESYIEAEIVSAMCLILNQKNDKRFQEQVYCLPPDIVNMAIAKHPKGKFISPKTNKEFRVEDYPMFIPFKDAKKLTSHPYGYIISRMRVYAGGAPLKRKEKEKEIRAPYVYISGQKTSYDCAIYVMKWLELIEPQNIKRVKYEWDNWTQDEVDHYRVEYAFRILFSKMNKDRAKVIRGNNAIRLSKPSSILLSPFCQLDSNDIETEKCNC